MKKKEVVNHIIWSKLIELSKKDSIDIKTTVGACAQMIKVMPKEEEVTAFFIVEKTFKHDIDILLESVELLRREVGAITDEEIAKSILNKNGYLHI